MSRVLMVKLNPSDVLEKCEKAKVGVSAIEKLPAGGVRLVLMSSDGAATMTRKFKSHLIKDPVTRERHRPIH